MRLGLIIYGTLDILSGGYLYDRKLVEYLSSQGDQVEVISLPWRNYARHLGDNLSLKLLQRLERLRLDVLIQDELNHPSLFWLNTRLRRRVNYPLVAIVHHLRSSEAWPVWQNHFYRWVERRYLASVDGFVFNSHTTRQIVEGLAGMKRPSVVARPAGDRLQPGISEAEIVTRARQPGPLRILFLGNVIPRKGLHTLLKALARLPSDRWRLVVAGGLSADGAYVREIHHQVEAGGLDKQVRFLGPLDEEEVAAQMTNSHIIAIPSSYEGFGIAYLEGMGFGLPAIATSGGAAQEIVTHGVNGYLIRPGDSQALANYLSEFSNDRERLATMSLAAFHQFSKHPTWEETGEHIRSFLRSTL